MLALYARETTWHPDHGKLYMYEIREPWQEMTSWDIKPMVNSDGIESSLFEPGYGWKYFDVTALVRSKGGNAQAHGIVLQFDEEGKSGSQRTWSGYAFVSREAQGPWEAARPILLAVK